VSHTSPEETRYHEAWMREVAPLDDAHEHPLRRGLQMALVGGRLAFGFASVFSAGYQAALRAVFPSLEFSGWAAFVVSEDRGADALAGVSYAPSDGQWLLDGHKSWVAGSRHVELLVTKAGRGKDAKYFGVPVQSAGLTLRHKDAPRMLPELSQAVADFRGVRASQPLDPSGIGQFGAAEVFFIYAAFVAWVASQSQDDEPRGKAQRILDSIFDFIDAWMSGEDDVDMNIRRHETPAIALAGLQRDNAAMIELDRQVQTLCRELGEGARQDDATWRRDQGLIAMYALRDPAPQ